MSLKEKLDQTLDGDSIEPTFYDNTSYRYREDITYSYEGYEGEETILGPFNYEYSKEIIDFKVYINGSECYSYQLKEPWGRNYWDDIEEYEILSGEDFYISIPTDELIGNDTLKIIVTVEGESGDLAELYIATANGVQTFGIVNLAEAEPEQRTFGEEAGENEYHFIIKRQLIIQKQHEEGDDLEVAGIEFDIYEDGRYLDTLETYADGQTDEIWLEVSKEYTIEEVWNEAYGYKNLKISDVYLDGEGSADLGGRWHSREGSREVTVSISSNAVLEIMDKRELGDLLVIKEGDYSRNESLPDVEFKIYNDYAGGYLQLLNRNRPVYEIIGSATIDENNDRYGYGYQVDYVSSYRDATVFITDNRGEFLLENLEIYGDKDEECNYYIIEESNPHYGYKGMIFNYRSVDVTNGQLIDVNEYDREVQVILGDNTEGNTEVIITNKVQLIDLTVKKEGNNSDGLSDVDLVIWQSGEDADGYIRVGNTTGPITGTEIRVDSPNITYVDNVEDATVFRTNSSGTITITNLEVYQGKDREYTYYVQEIRNENYGYKGIYPFEYHNMDIDGGYIDDVDNINKWVVFTGENGSTYLTIGNNQNLGSIDITKVDKDNTNKKLEGVEFKVTIDDDYIQLLDASGRPVQKVKGTATINKNNKATSSEYSVAYIEDIEQATTFITDSNGKIKINNLEVYSGPGDGITPTKYKYQFLEIENPNYGYTTYKYNIKDTKIQLEANQSTTFPTVTNEQFLGHIAVHKVDEFKGNRQEYFGSKYPDYLIPLEDIEYTLTIDKEPNTYVVLYRNGQIVRSVKGEATIHVDNKPTDNTTYEVRLVKLDKPYLQYSENERDNLPITIFKTDKNGDLQVNNLVVKHRKEDVDFTYTLQEVYNPWYGYEEPYNPANPNKHIYTTKLVKNKVMKSSYPMENKQELIKLSGYVWVDDTNDNKSNTYDHVYTNTNQKDKKLTDLYTTDASGNVIGENKNAQIPVQIKLRNKNTKQVLKAQPDIFYDGTHGDEKGKYIFNDVTIDNLDQYEVVFIYDGFYYTTVVDLELDREANGGDLLDNLEDEIYVGTDWATDQITSKVKENQTQRTALNNKFDEIKENGNSTDNSGIIVDNNVTEYQVQYSKDGHFSTVSGFDSKLERSIEATTTNANYSLWNWYVNKKSVTEVPIDTLENINMGLVLREQPKIAITSDIENSIVTFEDYRYTYNYNGRQGYYENTDNIDVGVKFEQENAKSRYTRAVYASDIQAATTGKKMHVRITYKITLMNKSTTLSVNIGKLRNYFDKEYLPDNQDGFTNTAPVAGDSIDGNHLVTSKYDCKTSEYNTEYAQMTIDLNGDARIDSGKSKTIYIQFDLQRNAVLKLLNQTSTYHNATEVISYSTYYGANTGTNTVENNKKVYFESESYNREGQIYAGIDKESQPGNAQIKLMHHPNGGTDILDTTNFEDDTTSSPSLILQKEEGTAGVRKISGNVWEDLKDASRGANERLGNGRPDGGEKNIGNVKVELHAFDNEHGTINPEVAKLSDGSHDANATTDGSGNYTLGFYNSNNDFAGIIPGKYVMKFIYSTGETYIAGQGGEFDVMDYKSTIVTPETIKQALKEGTDASKTITYNGQTYPIQRWYLTDNRYSDAIDDISLRPDMDPANTNVTNEKATSPKSEGGLLITEMQANTAIMDISIEWTAQDEANAIDDYNNATTMHDFPDKIGNVDFGIIERPYVDINVEKTITGLQLTAQNGMVIIPKDDPSNPDVVMKYVRTGLQGIVPIEMDSSLIQGATLELDYRVHLENNSEYDYINPEYYWYGEPKGTLRNTVAYEVVDYLDGDMVPVLPEDGTWKTLEKVDLTNESKDLINDAPASGRHIDNDVETQLNNGNFIILVTNKFSGVTNGKTGDVILSAKKLLGTSNEIVENNSTEIVHLLGGRLIGKTIDINKKYGDTNEHRDKVIPKATPGNYKPTDGEPKETDSSQVKLIITPPTGSTKDNTPYIIAITVTSIILVLGIVIIKKKLVITKTQS